MGGPAVDFFGYPAVNKPFNVFVVEVELFNVFEHFGPDLWVFRAGCFRVGNGAVLRFMQPAQQRVSLSAAQVILVAEGFAEPLGIEQIGVFLLAHCVRCDSFHFFEWPHPFFCRFPMPCAPGRLSGVVFGDGWRLVGERFELTR